MDTEQRNQPMRNLYPPRSFLYLIVEETCQHAMEIRKWAIEVQQTAQKMRQQSQLARQKRWRGLSRLTRSERGDGQAHQSP